MPANTARLRRLQRHLSAASVSSSGSASAGGSASGGAHQQHPLGVADVFGLQSVGGAQLSPDGTRLAYTVSTTDRVADSGETALWMAALDVSTPPLRMTAKGTSAGSPQWSPDGALLTFVSARATGADADDDSGPTAQVWALRLAGGEAFRLTAVEHGIESFEWSPDTTRPRLLLSVRDDLTVPKPAPSESKGETAKAEPWVMDSLGFKEDYEGYLDVTRGGVHLWVQEPAVPAEGPAAAAPTLTQITSGDNTDEHSAWSDFNGRILISY